MITGERLQIYSSNHNKEGIGTHENCLIRFENNTPVKNYFEREDAPWDIVYKLYMKEGK